MKIALLSDTHGTALGSFLSALIELKPDIVLHAGDLSSDFVGGNYPESFGNTQARELQAKHFLATWNAVADQLDCPIVMTPGNHDFFLAWPPPAQFSADGGEGQDWDFDRAQRPSRVPPGWVPPEIERKLDPRIKILNASGVRTKGLRLWGSPWTPYFGNWAYSFAPPENGGLADAARHWAQVPEDTDILITHGPPYRILDEAWQGRCCGCPCLRAELDSGRLRPKLHVFGHIHEARGQARIGETRFVNAAMGRGRAAAVVEM